MIKFEQNLPPHTAEALTNYLIHGYEPGGFLSAMLAGDLFRAASNADVVNRNVMYEIARCIQFEFPDGSWGSYEKIKEWCANKDSKRTKFKDLVEKAYSWGMISNYGIFEGVEMATVWNKLKEEHEDNC